MTAPARAAQPLTLSARVAATKRAAAQLFKMQRDPALVLWALYLLLDPIYIFKNGLPQPGDLMIILLLPVALVGWYAPGRLGKRGVLAMRALVVFIAYVIINALLWSMLDNTWTLSSKHGYLIAPAFYMFDAFVFLIVLVLFERYGERFVRLTIYLVLISVCLQTTITFFYSRGAGLRQSALFNTPNQLGYFAILAATILLVGQHRARGLKPILTNSQALVGHLCCTYLALLSASKAALASAFILMCVTVINRARTLLVILAVTAFFGFVVNPFEEAIERSRTRIAVDESAGFFVERGYDRIALHPEWLLFGAGEGNLKRFEDTYAGDHELHSSIGTLIFCFGFVGTFLFCRFIYTVVRGAPFARLLILLPPAAFGLTHQGLRFTLLWIMLAIVVMLNDLDQRHRTSLRSLRMGKAT